MIRSILTGRLFENDILDSIYIREGEDFDRGIYWDTSNFIHLFSLREWPTEKYFLREIDMFFIE